MNGFSLQVVRILEGENDHFHHLGEHFVPHYTKWRIQRHSLFSIADGIAFYIFLCTVCSFSCTFWFLYIYVVVMEVWNMTLNEFLCEIELMLHFGSVPVFVPFWREMRPFLHPRIANLSGGRQWHTLLSFDSWWFCFFSFPWKWLYLLMWFCHSPL